MSRHPLSLATTATVVAAVSLALAACGGDGPSGTAAPEAAIQVVNGFAMPVSVSVDGEVQLAALAPGSVSPRIGVSAGAHAVAVASGAGSSTANVTAVRGSVHAITASGAAGLLDARLLPDTAAIPAPGTAKLRVVHLAADAPAISVWRTQPDVEGPHPVMFPFRYGSESAYLQGAAGSWRVWVSPLQTVPPASPGDTATYVGVPTPELASSGPIALAVGEVRTAVLLRTADGGLRFELLAHEP